MSGIRQLGAGKALSYHDLVRWAAGFPSEDAATDPGKGGQGTMEFSLKPLIGLRRLWALYR